LRTGVIFVQLTSRDYFASVCTARLSGVELPSAI
jgi:hypothetical protein